MNKSIAFFDFDGTLTSKDSLACFIRSAVGAPRMLLGAVLLSPILLGYALGLIDNSKAKEKVLQHFFKGWGLEKFNQVGGYFADKHIPKILRPKGLEKLLWHKEQGHQVVIVSASAKNWLKDWADKLEIDLIATKLEVTNGKLTGSFFGLNCHGEEKVRRIKEAYNLTDFEKIYAYGDTSGDKPMLELASQNLDFYKPFQ